MSTRAYRLIKIDTVESASFNVWHDYEVTKYIVDDYASSLIMSLEVEDIKKILRNKKVRKEVKDALRADMKDAIAKGEGAVDYYCV